jgi:MoaA/NifB/PqqE/SkfB family radical SAM enzyme
MGLLDVMHALGAHKITFLGGEPTLYGRRTENSLRELLSFATELGYRYTRMDTNGLFPESIYASAGLDRLSELAFSLDGYDGPTNDRLRGLGTFRKITKQIRTAVDRGLRTSITCCIHDQLVGNAPDGITGVERVIRLGEELGVTTVNFHDLFKAGVPMDTWTGNFNTSVEQHIEMYNDVKPKIDSGQFSVKVRLPQCFVTRKEFNANPNYYGFCPVKLGERVMIHSDGVIRICSNLICSSFGTATYTHDTITWNMTASNELLKHELDNATPCTNRSKNMTYGDYVPLCFSFKPDQAEPSWNNLEWDSRRTVNLPFPSLRD